MEVLDVRCKLRLLSRKNKSTKSNTKKPKLLNGKVVNMTAFGIAIHVNDATGLSRDIAVHVWLPGTPRKKGTVCYCIEQFSESGESLIRVGLAW